MATSVVTEAALHSHIAKLFTSHEVLLSDRVRNQAFWSALKQCVTPGSSVLDIGAGTGIWAISAALLGARRVVALEADALLRGMIECLARDNGVGDRIEVCSIDSRAASLEREFDLIVSETIGPLAFDEQIVEIMADARRRFLRPRGVLIPQSVSLSVAPAHIDMIALPAGLDITYSHFDALKMNIPVEVSVRSETEFLGSAINLIEADLYSAEETPDLSGLSGKWEVERLREVNCFVLWAESKLTDRVRINAWDTTSWSALAYRISPFGLDSGTLEFRLALTPSCHYWKAIARNGRYEKIQSYSPADAKNVIVPGIWARRQ